MLPASVGIIGILYAAGAAWATLGVQLYGGLIYDGNEALEDTDYLDAKYDVLNCNDYAMSFISLFAFVTAGPFHEMIEAAEAVTSFPGLGYVYYISRLAARHVRRRDASVRRDASGAVIPRPQVLRRRHTHRFQRLHRLRHRRLSVAVRK